MTRRKLRAVDGGRAKGGTPLRALVSNEGPQEAPTPAFIDPSDLDDLIDAGVNAFTDAEVQALVDDAIRAIRWPE